MSVNSQSTSVLVIGGSLVGLSSALFLAAHNVPTILVERYAGSHPHPRAIGYTQRSLELFRSVGLGDKIPQAPPGFRLRRVRAESLAGKWHEESTFTPGAKQAGAARTTEPAAAAPPSPCNGAAIAQDRIEPILRQRAIELGADIRVNTELLSVTQTDIGVTAILKNRLTQQEYTVTSSYAIACDGHRSPVRESLGIARQGRGLLKVVRSVMFTAELNQYLKDGVHQFNIDQPGLTGFLTTYNDGRWVLFFTDDLERSDADLKVMISKAIGRDDIPFEVITTGQWEMTALIADKFSSGRIFLAGDAAHALPPNRGGYGANTGIEDAHNLAWKIAAVLSGQSTPRLLETYSEERRPIAWLRYQQIFARPDYKEYAPPTTEEIQIIDEIAMELGQLYRTAAQLVDNSAASLAPAARPEQWNGQPGTRALHMWLDESHSKTTLDLFISSAWTLISADEKWRTEAKQANATLGLQLNFVGLGSDVQYEGPTTADSILSSFGLKQGGASLIRPDGYVAWRTESLPPNLHESLFAALKAVAFPAKQ